MRRSRESQTLIEGRRKRWQTLFKILFLTRGDEDLEWESSSKEFLWMKWTVEIDTITIAIVIVELKRGGRFAMKMLHLEMKARCGHELVRKACNYYTLRKEKKYVQLYDSCWLLLLSCCRYYRFLLWAIWKDFIVLWAHCALFMSVGNFRL